MCSCVLAHMHGTTAQRQYHRQRRPYGIQPRPHTQSVIYWIGGTVVTQSTSQCSHGSAGACTPLRKIIISAVHDDGLWANWMGVTEPLPRVQLHSRSRLFLQRTRWSKFSCNYSSRAVTYPGEKQDWTKTRFVDSSLKKRHTDGGCGFGSTCVTTWRSTLATLAKDGDLLSQKSSSGFQGLSPWLGPQKQKTFDNMVDNLVAIFAWKIFKSHLVSVLKIQRWYTKGM